MWHDTQQGTHKRGQEPRNAGAYRLIIGLGFRQFSLNPAPFACVCGPTGGALVGGAWDTGAACDKGCCCCCC